MHNQKIYGNNIITELENVCKYTQTDINQCSYENLEFLLGSIKYLKQQTIEQQ